MRTWLTALVVLFLLVSGARAASTAGVELSPQESAWIAAHPVIQVGVYAGNHFPLEAWVAGAPDGFGVDYAKRLASRVGLRLQFRPFTEWDYVAFDDVDKPVPFDLLVAQPYGRNSRFEYLKPYVESGFVMAARKGDLQILDESSLAHARIATERFGKYFNQRIKQRFPDATMVYADDARQALDMVAQGQADAFIGTPGRTRWLLAERERDDLSILARLPDMGTLKASLAVPRDQAMLAAILRKAEASISDDELSDLKARWGYSADLSSPIAHGRSLTEDDRRWLAQLGTLRVGYEADRYPYSFMDKDGALDGLSSDYLSLIKSELGLRLEFVPARDLDELQRRVAAKEVDLVAAAMPADYDPSSMAFTRAYERFPEVIVSRLGGPAIAGPEDLRGRRVAVREEAGLISSLKMLLPRTDLVPVVSNEEGLKRLSDGQVDAYIGTLPAIDALIRDRYAASLHVVAPAGLDQDFTMGISRDKARLAGLIDNVIGNLKDSQRQAMRSHWLRADYNYGAPWGWVLLGLAISASVVAVIGFAYKRMRVAEARARASEQRLVDTNENLPGVVMRLHIDASERYTCEYVSGPTRALFGMSHADILSGAASPLDTAQQQDRDAVRAMVVRASRSHHAEVVEFRVVVDGVTRWIRTLGGELKPTGGGGYFWSVYCADVTLLKEQERALVEAKATAEAAVAAKSAFLAMMSHEIRTPMAGVLGLIELLSKTPLNPEQSHMVGMVQDSALALLQILDDILDFSRIEAEKLELEPRPFDLRKLADGAMGTFIARAQQKDIHIYLVLDWRLASEYRGDANRIRQIINNLLSNALKFTSVGHVELRVDVVGTVDGGQRLRFGVTDTGIGISTDQLNRLFQPFTQAEASTTRRFGGTGLGLSICRRLAHMMGGDVRLSSEAGGGTQAVFEVTLPVLQNATAIPDLAGKRALVCTRDGMLERELANTLSAMGMGTMEVDPEDVAEFTGVDADIYIADALLIEQGVAVPGVPAIHVLPETDPRGFYVEDGKVMLCGSPLLWRSSVDACRLVLGLQPQRPAKPVASPDSARHVRVLVAEDHPINRVVIERQLDLLGYDHTVVEDGQQAWEALAAGHYDVLITDCHMPVLDGYALTQRIRESEVATQAHLPIIALSASALPEQVEKCRKAGMDDFLAKPVQLDELRQKISGLQAGEDAGGPSSGQDQLAYLAGVIGSEAQLKGLLEGLLDAGHADITRLDAAIATGDVETQRELIHRLVGSLRLIDPKTLESSEHETLSQRRDAIVDQLVQIRALVEQLEARF
ncbi:ATP-binding protein [Dyella telluris]|uniref:histidine kinase n=1 Tax=Dyella telluris TaxID=2763498 RepID=A0A7G8Q3W2_9GAMM|nr:transporter substrate-binding domain-containing protein [Dyella telluris]QNK01470.1 transporter substrate-binding domain-containing protein [Dyella telluris]